MKNGRLIKGRIKDLVSRRELIFNPYVAKCIRYTISLHLYNNSMNYHPCFTAEENGTQRE